MTLGCRQGIAALAIAALAACGPPGPRGGPAGSPGQAQSQAGSSDTVEISARGGQICVRSNGLPGHATGQFPNPGNPNRISAQRIDVCVDANPTKGPRPVAVQGSIGIAVNGVMIRPGTADWYDASAPRGFSRDRSSGWNLEGMGAAEMLGLDQNNAHVDPRGLYHYHGIPTGLVPKMEDGLVGWAADGFPMYLADATRTASWRLKSGQRPTAPFGAHDGTYVEDWVHVPGSGSLDQCNGGERNGAYVYFVTDTFPFYPRCLWGEPSRDFRPPRR
ncbi:MAG: YHYH protein [Pseudomonadota bacterium]